MDLLQEMQRQASLLCAPRTPEHDRLAPARPVDTKAGAFYVTADAAEPAAAWSAPADTASEHDYTVMTPLQALLTGTPQDLVIALGSAVRHGDDTVDLVWRDAIRRIAVEYSGYAADYVDAQLAELDAEMLQG